MADLHEKPSVAMDQRELVTETVQMIRVEYQLYISGLSSQRLTYIKGRIMSSLLLSPGNCCCIIFRNMKSDFSTIFTITKILIIQLPVNFQTIT